MLKTFEPLKIGMNRLELNYLSKPKRFKYTKFHQLMKLFLKLFFLEGEGDMKG